MLVAVTPEKLTGPTFQCSSSLGQGHEALLNHMKQGDNGGILFPAQRMARDEL